MTRAPERNVLDLQGDALLVGLAQAGDVDGLELLWRAHQPELAQRLASHLASVGDSRLGDVLLSELAAPAMSPGMVRPHVLGAIDAHQPPLSDDGIRRLEEALMSPEPSTLAPAADRELLERWLFAQPGERRDAYAKFVIESEVELRPAAGTLASALAGTAQNDELRASVAQIYCTRLVGSKDGASWARAAEFVERGCEPGNRQPEVLALVDEVVRFAPALAPAPPLQPTLANLVRQHAYEALESLLSGEAGVAASSGMTALLQIADSFPRQAQRLGVFMLAYGRHPSQWPALEPLAKVWDETRWGQVLRRILATTADQLPAKLSPLLALAPAAHSALLVEIAATHQHPADDPGLPELVASKAYDAFNVARTHELAIAHVMWWPRERDEDGRAFLRGLIAGFGMDEDMIHLLTAGLVERAASPRVIVSLLPDGRAKAFVGNLRAAVVEDGRYRQVLDALLGQRLDEFRQAADALQREEFDLRIAAVLAATDPDVAFRNAETAYDALDGPSRDSLLELVERHGTESQVPLVERFARASERSERPRRARAFAVASRLLPRGEVPDYITDGLLVTDAAVSNAGFAAISALRPRDSDVLRDLRGMAGTDGRIARPAGTALEDLTDVFANELRNQITPAQRCDLLTSLGAAARPRALDLLLGHLGDAELDDVSVHRAAAKALLEAVPFVEVTTAHLARLGDLLDGDDQESDPAVREALSEASQLASLGPDAALDLLYTMARIRPKASPDRLFGLEKGTLIRQLGLYKRESDRGAAGQASAIAHLDNVAERIVRAAYLRLGSSEDIKRRIGQSSRDPDYGHVLKSLGGRLEKAKSGFGMLHDIRSDGTEVPHPGRPMTEGSWTAAREGFAQAANASLAALDAAIPAEA